MPSHLIKPAKDDQDAQAFFNDYMSEQNTGKRYLMGTTALALDVAKNVPFDAFIDDFTDQATVAGKPVIKTTEIPENSLVLSMVVNARPWTAKKKLDQLGVRNLDYFSFRRVSTMTLPSAFFWESFKREFEEHVSDYEALYDLLSDDTSRKQFVDILNFRYHEDMRWLQDYPFIPEQQYFEDFLHLKESNESFADVGGFDGFTSEEFIRYCPNYNEIHFFEPIKQNMDVAKAKLGGQSNITFHPYGLSNQPRTLRFTAAGSASHPSETGDTEISLERLDDLTKARLTFIKMDIEGGELDAIEGAQQAIKNHHPRLAIAAYHLIDDFRTIAKSILSMRDDYRLYLRHYTESMTETVLFFIPEKESE